MLFIIAAWFGLAAPLAAQIVVPPEPASPSANIRIENLDVQTKIENQVARTTVRQTIVNPTRRQIEGQYLFPLPEGARVTDFTLSLDGEELTGEVLDEAEARQIYESIVRRRKDPGLLKYVGQGALRAKVFPLGPEQKRTVKIEYQQRLRAENGRVEYRLPLNLAKNRAAPASAVTVDVDLRDKAELKAVRSPSHSVDVTRRSSNHVNVHYSAENQNPERDFLLYYTTGEARFGIDAMTYRSAGEPGYFSLSITPSFARNLRTLPKDIAFVLDVSGSMRSDRKLKQAREALDYIVGSLNPKDRFNLISFSSRTETFRDELREVSAETKREARDYIQGLSAGGSTNLHEAVTRGLKLDPENPDRPFMVVLLTDGKPTAGKTTEPDQIIKAAREAGSGEARIFTVGVGYDVNSIFLDRLTDKHNGERLYVTPEENLEGRLSAFYGKIANPVLSSLSLAVDGVQTREVYPVELPDLFKGSQLVLHGRYENSGPADVTLTGQRAGETVTVTRTISFPERRSDYDFLPRSWARVKIGYLIDQIRQHGMNSELKRELTRLSKDYGIVTPYTASLIREDEELAQRPQFRELREEYSARSQQLSSARDRAMKAGSGQASFEASVQADKLQEAEPMESKKKEQASRKYIKQVGPKTFYLADGVWYDRQYKESAPVEKVEYLSPEYFQLLEKQPELGRYFALGEQVVVRHNNTFYRVVSAVKE